MEQHFPLLDQDVELLYIQLSQPSVSYVDMINFCSVSHATKILCEDNLMFKQLLEKKKYEWLLQLPYNDLIDICDERKKEIGYLCKSQSFWKLKTKRDFGVMEKKPRNQKWKKEYEDHLFHAKGSFFEAVAFGEIDEAKKYLDFGLNVNMWWSHGMRPLHFAVRDSQKEMVKYLIDRGADVHLTDEWGDTPLEYAENEDIIEILKKYM